MRPVTPITSGVAAEKPAKTKKARGKSEPAETAPAGSAPAEIAKPSSSKAVVAIAAALEKYSTHAQAATDAITSIAPPKDLGTAADMLLMLRAAKTFAADLSKALESLESATKNYLVDNVPKSSQTGAVGKLASARIVLKQVPHVTDWNAAFAYIAKEKAWDLVQRRLSDKAVTERWENGKKIPGVEPFSAISVSITKLKT